MARNTRRKVWIAVNDAAWQAFRVRCMQSGQQVQHVLGELVIESCKRPLPRQVTIEEAIHVAGQENEPKAPTARTRTRRPAGAQKKRTAAARYAGKPAGTTKKAAAARRGRTAK